MKNLNINFKETFFADKLIKIPIWQFYEFIFSIPFSLVLLYVGIIAISDGLFDTHYTEPNLGMPGVFMGIVFIFPSIHLVRRIIKYPGIIFTKDYVVIPPVRFFHWSTRIIHYNKIIEINFGSFKFDYRILLDNNKWITFPQHNNTNMLWGEFNDELCRRHVQAFKAMGKNKKAKELYESYEDRIFKVEPQQIDVSHVATNKSNE
jgi:hypothetical protein